MTNVLTTSTGIYLICVDAQDFNFTETPRCSCKSLVPCMLPMSNKPVRHLDQLLRVDVKTFSFPNHLASELSSSANSGGIYVRS